MIAGLKSYAATKNSGIGWIGEVPTHWEVTALRNRYEQCLGKMLDAKQGTGEHLMPYLRNVDVQWDRINVVDLPKIDIRPKEVERYTVRRGDLLVCEGGEVGRSAIWMEEIKQCAYQKALHRLRPRHRERDRPRFLLHALRVAVERGAFYDGHESTIGHLTGEKLRAHRFAFPSETEQRKIEAFLDHMNRRIQGYIRAKQKLITLLDEQKQAVIHNTVTGKVDVRTGQQYKTYRDAGVDDVGAIPDNWRIVPLKRVLSRIIDCEHKTAPAVDESEYFVIRTTAVRNGTLRWKGAYCTDSDSFGEWTRRSVPRYGDVIFTREAPAGEACVVPRGKRVCLGQRTVLLRPEQGRYDPHFLVHMIYEGPPKSRIQLAAQGSTVGHFNVDDIGSMPVLLPTLEEQTRIVEHVESVTDQIDAARSRLDRGAQVLREYRKRLIADVVTGKLDVREFAEKLPEVDTDDVEREYDDSVQGGTNGDIDEMASTMNETAA